MNIEPLTLLFDLFLVGSGIAVVAWMVREYQQSIAEGVGNHDRRTGVSENTHREIVPLAVNVSSRVSSRPRTTSLPCGEIPYSALANRTRRVARPAAGRSARAVADGASSLRFEHRG